jgi:hypothetical protein
LSLALSSTGKRYPENPKKTIAKETVQVFWGVVKILTPLCYVSLDAFCTSAHPTIGIIFSL